MNRIFLFAFLFILLLSGTQLYAQQPAEPGATRRIDIVRTNTLSLKKTNDTTDLQVLVGNVIVKQENTTFYCDSAIINQNLNTLEAFGKVHINSNDSINTYSDYLRYVGNDKKAYLKNNVRLTDGKGTLTTPELEYDTETKIGTYTKTGKLVSGTTTLTSNEGYYYSETHDAYFKKKVVLVNPEYVVKTDTLLYNSATNIATFVVPTEIASGTKKIYTSDGYYNLNTKKSYFGKRSTVQDSTSTLTANEMASDDSSNYFEARGNAIFRDTARGLALFANNLKGNRTKGSLLATEHPVMMIKQDKDSLFVAADTLYASKLSTFLLDHDLPPARDSTPPKDSLLAFLKRDSTKDRYFEAYYHVRIFSDSLQATCDSLFYSAADSTFRLIKQPVVWAQNSQVTGDTIYLFTSNKKPERLYVFENALTVSDIDSSGMYNQVKGRTINAYFQDGAINFIRSRGNAEAVYYSQDDDKKFVGVDKSTCDILDTYFKDRKPFKVSRISDLKGTFYPIQQVNNEDMKLRGFTWQESKRPKSKYELFGK